MKNRIFAALTLVFASVCVSDPVLAFQQGVKPQECGNLAQYAGRLALEFGWTREQAIGALANFAHESRGRAIEQLGMPAGTGGFGWAQWTGARRYAFMTFARANGMSPAGDAANYAFLAHELRSNYAFVAQRMRQARSAAEATVIFARDYEGAFSPGAIASMASRHQWARALGAMAPETAPSASVAAAVAAVAPAVKTAAAVAAVPSYKTASPIYRAAVAPVYRTVASTYRTAAPGSRTAAPIYRTAARTNAAATPTYAAAARSYRAYRAFAPAYRMSPRLYRTTAWPYRMAAR